MASSPSRVAGDRVLRQAQDERGGDATPNLPALITALPGPGSGSGAGYTRAPQTEFTRARQVLFLENLSVTGAVRSAAAAAQVSHLTAYRARRATAAFRAAWDAALVVARASAESVLACRALDGVEEKVFYHGEEVATRKRYSDRLLLAHLARLDRHAADDRINAIAEDFDAALARFEAGEELAPGVGAPSIETPAFAGIQPRSPAQAGASGGRAGGEEFSHGPCNTRSMSASAERSGGDEDAGADAGADAVDGAADGAELDADGAGDRSDDAAAGWDPDDGEECSASAADYADLLAGESARTARLPLIDRLLAAMERHRPADAPRLSGPWNWAELENAQLGAFAARAPDWWLVVPPPPGARPDGWRYAGPEHCLAEG